MHALTITATDKNLPTVNDFIHSIIEPYSPSNQIIFALDLAIEELFVNIAHYAYAPNEGNVTVTCSVKENPNALTVTLSDSGIPYNPLLKPDPDVTQKLEDRRIGGMGIYLTKKYVDEISYAYKNNQNTITITKILK